MKAPSPHRNERTFGPIIGSRIIVLLLMLGALYFWAQKLHLDEKKKLEADRRSDISSIKADLNAADVETLNKSLEAIE